MSRRVHHDRERRSHEDPTVRIERCTARTLEDWVALRYAVWPEGPAEEHRLEAQALVGRRSRAVAFLARTPSRLAVGFAEATLRRDYVNGCTTSPVAFLEGIYVRPAFRRRGVARLLCAAVTDWATERGCTELASDALLRNTASHRMHAALGFEETERVVFFRKLLPAVRR